MPRISNIICGISVDSWVSILYLHIHMVKEKKSEFDHKVLDLSRVARVVAGGRRFRFRAVVVIGDRNHRVGIGVRKGKDVASAVEKSVASAKKNIIKIAIKDGTIPHEVEAKFSSARVLLKPARQGKGIIAGGAVRTVCEFGGIKNISAKIIGRTKNKLNNAMATVEALKKIKSL